MGRKNKRVYSNKHACFTKQQKRDIKINTDQLLRKCTLSPSNAAEEWDIFLSIQELLKNIIKIQNGYGLEKGTRDEKFQDFRAWMTENGVSMDSVELAIYPDMGHGLKTTKDMKSGELFLNIPRKVMMLTDSANNSYLGPLIKQDEILQLMSNVSLALFLLCEAHTQDSFWKPYIDILPDEYPTVLYYSPDELQLLKGSPALSDALIQCRSIARQYAYFYHLFQSSDLANCVPMKDGFTYEDYRWAVSTVMTRQNPIPTEDGSGLSYGLIPLWDMCNHKSGQITTNYNVESQCGDFYCMEDAGADEQIYICYGARSSAEFLLHNGFVSSDNKDDFTLIKLGVSKNDAQYSLKSDILSRVNLQLCGSYKVLGYGNHIDPDLLAFLRIFVADKECLELLDADESLLAGLRKYTRTETFNDDSVFKFLQTRISLILRAYPDKIQTWENVSGNVLQIQNLMRNEKATLLHASRVLQDLLSL